MEKGKECEFVRLRPTLNDSQTASWGWSWRYQHFTQVQIEAKWLSDDIGAKRQIEGDPKGYITSSASIIPSLPPARPSTGESQHERSLRASSVRLPA
jgi:hypothetical protein